MAGRHLFHCHMILSYLSEPCFFFFFFFFIIILFSTSPSTHHPSPPSSPPEQALVQYSARVQRYRGRSACGHCAKPGRIVTRSCRMCHGALARCRLAEHEAERERERRKRRRREEEGKRKRLKEELRDGVKDTKMGMQKKRRRRASAHLHKPNSDAPGPQGPCKVAHLVS